jgi:hypothetical protein
MASRISHTTIGQPFAEYATDGYDTSYFNESTPNFQRVLQVRAERQQMVTDFLNIADDSDLMEQRVNPWAHDHTVTVGKCISVILNEEWEHLRFALRDIETLGAHSSAPNL